MANISSAFTAASSMKTKPSIMSVELRAALNAVGEKLYSGKALQGEVEAVVRLLNDLSPLSVTLVSGAIRNEANLFGAVKPQSLWKSLVTPLTHRNQLHDTPGLALLFLFHGNGQLRELALEKITQGLVSPFWVAAVLFRMNDWAVQVRESANRCVERVLPVTPPHVLAEVALMLFPRQSEWGRWNDAGQTLARSLMTRPDIGAEFATLLMSSAAGPVPTSFRLALKTPWLDTYLSDIATHATNPIVRAIAVETLLQGTARWRSGYEHKWLDKRYNITKLVPVYTSRPLDIASKPEPIAMMAITDRSAFVRRTFLQCADRHTIPAELSRTCAKHLANDHDKSVRDLAAFILSKR
ncbi:MULTISPECIES: hypothetical protein [unclassified Rhizobium]|uniref:hypothetical protein n=1 Tax=unclassified Rhizobium TaxID=2613769 RepID=UPI001AE275C5|nr:MULTISPECIES: hypothetical protein [unclassified Rhizobium]MBP2461445.1 hypothetical protein [Rhizobium sp. PvP014]MBP2528841.1 hypothetical protein [Rhizobium sp. PvP099]